MTLMTIKTPITDADAIRALACQALAGLARSETVRQIISKLPLFTTGQLQSTARIFVIKSYFGKTILNFNRCSIF